MRLPLSLQTSLFIRPTITPPRPCTTLTSAPHLRPYHSRRVTNISQPFLSSFSQTRRTLSPNARMASTDPYKSKNQDEPGTAEKIQDLSQFIKSSKFGMMTTRADALLVSRCMAVAGQVRLRAPIDVVFSTCTHDEFARSREPKQNPTQHNSSSRTLLVQQ